MSKCQDTGSNYVDSLTLDSPLDISKIGELSPILGAGDGKQENIKPTRRGRKRNADKLAPKLDTNSSSNSSGDDGGTGGEAAPVVKPKRGRGRPSGSTNRTNGLNKAITNAANGGGGEPFDPNDPCNAARERSRVKTLRDAFLELQRSLPSVPPDTKLSKLDVLVLATTYISHLMRTLDGDQSSVSGGGDDTGGCGVNTNLDKHHRLKANGYLHPVKKWPMRSRLYAGAAECILESSRS